MTPDADSLEADRRVEMYVTIPTFCKPRQVRGIAESAAKHIHHSVNSRARVFMLEADGELTEVTYVRKVDAPEGGPQ